MSTPITLTAFHCNACALDFTSGIAAPMCLRCNSRDVTAQGQAGQLSVPAPIPAGSVMDEETIAAQVRANAGNVVQLTYRCPVCGWTERFPAGGEPPASITAHEATHPE